MAQVGPQDNWGTGPPPGGPQGAQYTSIMIDTSGDKWPFERFRQISVVLAVIGIIYMACAVLFFAVYLGVGGTNVRVGVLLIFTVFTIGTGGLMIATYKCGRRLSMDHPRLHKYSGLYLLLVTLDVLFTLMMFGYSIKVVDIMEHTIPAESIGSSKVMPIIITINSVAAIAVSMLGLFGSCCRYPVKRVIETPIRVDGEGQEYGHDSGGHSKSHKGSLGAGIGMLTWQPILEHHHAGYHFPPPEANPTLDDKFWYLLLDAIIAINSLTGYLGHVICNGDKETRTPSTMSFKTAHTDGVYPTRKDAGHTKHNRSSKTPPSTGALKQGRKGQRPGSMLSFKSAASSLHQMLFPQSTVDKPLPGYAHVTVEDYNPLKDYNRDSEEKSANLGVSNISNYNNPFGPTGETPPVYGPEVTTKQHVRHSSIRNSGNLVSTTEGGGVNPFTQVRDEDQLIYGVASQRKSAAEMRDLRDKEQHRKLSSMKSGNLFASTKPRDRQQSKHSAGRQQTTSASNKKRRKKRPSDINNPFISHDNKNSSSSIQDTKYNDINSNPFLDADKNVLPDNHPHERKPAARYSQNHKQRDASNTHTAGRKKESRKQKPYPVTSNPFFDEDDFLSANELV